MYTYLYIYTHIHIIHIYITHRGAVTLYELNWMAPEPALRKVLRKTAKHTAHDRNPAGL